MDGLQAELLKHDIESLVMPLFDLFNLTIFLGFHDSWTKHIIHRIHKVGDPHEPNNYRTIMIGHIFAKLYSMALDVLLSHRLEDEGHLKTIIEEAHSRSLRVFCYFMDFRKAFYTIPCHFLFKIFQFVGISGDIL